MGHKLGCVDRSCIGWYQRHVVRVFSALCPPGRLVYGALVAVVVAMEVYLLAWAIQTSFILGFD